MGWVKITSYLPDNDSIKCKLVVNKELRGLIFPPAQTYLRKTCT